MTSTVERGNVKKVSMDRWSTRERLCLASAVFRSGDQNWMSVSRSLRMFGEPNRPPDWFSQKNCAVQYSMLLENVETPKRKKRSEKGEVHVETPGESIVRKLTNERIEELKVMMQEKRAAYLRLKEEVLQVRAGHADDRLADMLREIEEEKRQKEKLAEAHELWLREREEKKLDMERNWKPVPSQSPVHRRKGGLPRGIGGRRSSSQSEHSSEADSPINEPLNVEIVGEEPPVDVKPTIAPMPTSPLLTSLLKSPSPAPNAQTSLLQQAITNRGSSPTITSLLSSSPAVPTTVSSSLKNLVSNALSGVGASVDHSVPSSVSPSAGAPTLSMLLEMPPNAPGQPLPELPTTVSKPLPPPVVTDDKLRQRDPSAIPSEMKNNESVKIVVVEPKSEPVEHIPVEPKEEPVEEELIEEMVVSDDAVLAAEVIPNVSGSITNDVPETTVVTEELQTIIKKEIKEEYTLDPQTSEPVVQVKMDPDRELLPEVNVSELISTSLPSCVTKEEKIVEDAETTNKNDQIASSAEEIVLDKDFEMIIEGTMQELTEESDAKGDVSDIAEVVEFEEGSEVKEVIPPDLADMEVIILGKVNDEVVDVSDEAKLLEVVVEKEESNMQKVQTDVTGEVTSIPVSNEAESAEEKLSPSGSTMEIQDANVSQSTPDDDDYAVDVCTSSVDTTETEQPYIKQDRKGEGKPKSEEEKSQQMNEFTKSKIVRSSSPDSRTEEEGLLQKSESLVSELSTEESKVPVANDVESEEHEVDRPAGATADNKKSPERNEPAEKATRDKESASSSEVDIVPDELSEASDVSKDDKVANDHANEAPHDSKKSTDAQLGDDDKQNSSAHTEISDTVCEQVKEIKDTLLKPGKKSGPHKEEIVHVTTKDADTLPLSQDVNNDRKEVEPSLNQEETQKKKTDNHKTVDKLPKEETAHETKTSHAVDHEKTICTDEKNNIILEKKDVTSNVKEKKDNKKEVIQQEVKENIRGGREGDKEGKRENTKKQPDDVRKKTDTDKKDVKEVNRNTTKKTEKENTHRRDGSAKRKEDNSDEREDVKKRAVEKDDRKDTISKEGIKRELDVEVSVKKLDSRKSEKSSKMENRKEHKKNDSKKENEVRMTKKSVELPPEPMDVKTVNLQQEDTTESECESEKTPLKDLCVQSSTHKDARKTYGDTHTEAQQENAKGGKSGTHAIRADTPSTEEEKTSDAESTKPSIKKRSAAASSATADSVPSSPGYHTEDEREYKAWKKAIMLVYGRLATHKYASLFLRPITDDQAPGYSSIVHRPMDLLMIKKNIETGMIRTTSEFQRDVLLMFQNSIMYNKSSHFVHNMARQMQQEGMQHIQDFLTTQMLVQVVGEVPLRRETRTTEANKNRDVQSGQEESDAGGKRKRVSGAEVERNKKRKV